MWHARGSRPWRGVCDGMAWMITSEDSADAGTLRANKPLMAAHWAYELSIRDKILAAGSLRTDDGQRAVGSLLIVNVATRAQAQAIIDAAMMVQTGAADVVIAGGVESMSNVEHYTTDIRSGTKMGGLTMHDRLTRGRVMSQPVERFGLHRWDQLVPIRRRQIHDGDTPFFQVV